MYNEYDFVEPSDYNDEYFYLQQDEYIPEDEMEWLCDGGIDPKVAEVADVQFTIWQTISLLQEVGEKSQTLGIAAAACVGELNRFLEKFDAYCEGEK